MPNILFFNDDDDDDYDKIKTTIKSNGELKMHFGGVLVLLAMRFYAVLEVGAVKE